MLRNNKALKTFYKTFRILLVLSLAFTSCMAEDLPNLERTTLTIDSKPPLVLQTAIADNDQTRADGLKHVKKMNDDSAMLFVFKKSRPVSFWMQDTLIPLSIAYIDERGVILQIEKMEPLDETSIPSRGPVKYALEVNQGIFKKYNVKKGNRINSLNTDSNN